MDIFQNTDRLIQEFENAFNMFLINNLDRMTPNQQEEAAQISKMLDKEISTQETMNFLAEGWKDEIGMYENLDRDGSNPLEDEPVDERGYED